MNTRLLFAISCLIVFLSFNTFAQLKQIYKDTDEDNEVRKISLYSKSEGYITFKKWIGYTTDGGATYQKKVINASNVNFSGYQVNLTFGFALTGTIAFDKNNLIVYGDYGLVPAILSSSDGGANFKLVYHAQASGTKFSYMTDMVFPDNGATGYAIDEDRIFKTTNKGLTWTVMYTAVGSYFKSIHAIGTSFLAVIGQNQILRSTNLGASWNQMNLPATLGNNSIQCGSFLSATKAWINSSGGIYSTPDAGNSWALKNNLQYDPVNFTNLQFVSDDTGFAIGSAYKVYKTSNAGKNWEVLPRENDFTYLGYSHYTMYFWSTSEFLVGGGYGLLEYTNNGGGAPIPKAIFSVDKTALITTGSINLTNYSRTDYTYKWYKNDVLFATSYNTSYLRTTSTKDVIRLEVSNGIKTESTIQEIILAELPVVTSFAPQSAGAGEKVILDGSNFTRVSKVTVGGINSSFVINSANKITITISGGASGDIILFSPDGITKTGGFTFIPPPVITSFAPTSALPGSQIKISGNNFDSVKEIRFGGTLATDFKVESPGSITATVGAGSSGKVTIATAGGSAELAGFVLQPVLSAFFPKSGTINEFLTIDGAGFDGVTSVTLGGVAVKSFRIISPTQITAVIGNSGNGNLTISKPGGTASLGSFTFYYAPQISTFLPKTASVGSEVRISGSGFSSKPEDNIVYFGGVRAVVSASSSTQLTVTVPSGAGYGSISVSYHNLTAYSSGPFSPIVSGNNVIANNPFREANPEFGAYVNYALNAIGDFDGDGKLDCAVPDINSQSKSGFCILKNKSNLGSISFSKTNLFGLGGFYYYLSCADMDGDGKLDIIAADQDRGEIIVFRNISTSDNINFEKGVAVSGIRVSKIIITDLDHDGKPDVVTGNTVLKNSSSAGSISFFDKITITAEGDCNQTADIDNDGWTDLYFVSYFSGKFTVLRNVSSIGSIAFGLKTEFPEKNVRSLSIGDMDNDGKQDLATLSAETNMLIVYRNNSISGQIMLTRETKEFATPPVPVDIGLNDLDGDGKLDIMLSTREKKILSIFKNNSKPGSISLADRVDQDLASNIVGLGFADFDGDGKPDVIGGALGEMKFKTLHNLITTSPFITSFNPTIAYEGKEILISGVNFDSATKVQFGQIDAQSFTIRSATEILAKVGKGESGEVSVSNSVGRGSKGGFSFGIAPKISSFSPQSGPSGTNVTIKGADFDIVPLNNIVIFGDVPAKVLSATASELVVEAPRGSKQSNISVTTNNLTAYSGYPYINTYAGATAEFDKDAYAEPQKFKNNAFAAAMTDVDGDGILDVVTEQNATFSILRNAGLKNKVSFDPPQDFKHDYLSVGIGIADFDGDGKQDFLLNNQTNGNVSNTFSILRNRSTPGQIIIDAKKELSVTGSMFLTADIDQDGKPDIVIVGNSVINVLRNISNPGEIKFEKPYYISFPGYRSGFSIADFDSDGKPDLAIISSGPGALIQMRNTSVPGSFSFALATQIPVSAQVFQIATADLDADGWIDVVAREYNANKYTLFKNTSGILGSPQNLNFPTVDRIGSIAVADLDGDGKMDILGDGVSVFKNSSTSSAISFNNEVKYHNTVAGSAIMGDLDGDDRPDILFTGYPMRIFVNQVGKPIPVVSSFNPKKATLDQTITITGSNFSGTNNVQIGDFPAKSFTVNSAGSITAILGEGSSGRIMITNAEGTGLAEGFEYIPQPVISGFSPIATTESMSFTIYGSGFLGATAVKFGGVGVTSFRIISDFQIEGIVGKASSGLVEVTTPIGTAKKEGYVYVPKPVITANGSTTLPPGENLTLSVNVAANVKYQWYRNGFVIAGATGSAIMVTESASYTVSSSYENLYVLSEPIVVTAPGTLPANNLKVKVVNESCKKNDDGLIEVIAGKSLKYTARLFAGGTLIKTSSFTQNASFSNLGSGSYTVCVTHEDDASYNKCFTVSITEPKDVVLTSTINPDKSITLMMGGADIYFISLNGKEYQNTTGELTLPLSVGNNALKVSTTKECQGVIERNIVLKEGIKTYPNPFDDEVTVQLPLASGAAEVIVQIYNASGNKVYEKKMVNTTSYFQINLSSLPSGLYILKAFSDQDILQTKIIKK